MSQPLPGRAIGQRVGALSAYPPLGPTPTAKGCAGDRGPATSTWFLRKGFKGLCGIIDNKENVRKCSAASPHTHAH